MLGRILQAPQRLGGTIDELPTEERLNQPTPPAWRELERSTERHAARGRTDGRHPNHFFVDHAKGQVNVECTLLPGNDLANLKPHRHPMSRPSAKDKAIALLQFAVRRLNEGRLRPAGEFAWHQNRPPYLGSRSADKFRWAHVQHQTECRLLQVGMDDADEILGCASTFGLRAAARKHVLSDMTLEHVGHQTVHRPTR